jgi:hypothetical protein
VLLLLLGSEFLKAQRPELIPTDGHKGCIKSYPKVWRLGTLEVMVCDKMRGKNL